jgi:hypothetical protein
VSVTASLQAATQRRYERPAGARLVPLVEDNQDDGHVVPGVALADRVVRQTLRTGTRHGQKSEREARKGEDTN